MGLFLTQKRVFGGQKWTKSRFWPRKSIQHPKLRGKAPLVCLWVFPINIGVSWQHLARFFQGTNTNFSVCYIIFLQNIGHGQHVERKKFLKKLHLGVPKILQKWRFFGLKRSFCKLWAIFGTPKSASNSKKFSEALF